MLTKLCVKLFGVIIKKLFLKGFNHILIKLDNNRKPIQKMQAGRNTFLLRSFNKY
jgi:hypothetical protein